MKLGKAFKSLLEDAKSTDAYWVEQAKLDFAINLEKQRVGAQMTYAAIAKKIGTSAAYITKIFRGDSNVTIETMVKLARATGGQIEIQIVDTAPQAVEWNTSGAKQGQTTANTTVASATIIEFPVAANHGSFYLQGLAVAA